MAGRGSRLKPPGRAAAAFPAATASQPEPAVAGVLARQRAPCPAAPAALAPCTLPRAAAVTSLAPAPVRSRSD